MSRRPDPLGRPLPRLRIVPKFKASEALEACELAAGYGLTADDWQEDILEGWLARVAVTGSWAAKTCGASIPRQNGKNAVIEIRELYGMVMLGEKFLHTAHEVKTARKAFRRLCSFFDPEMGAAPEMSALVLEIRRTNGQEAILLTNGGSIEFVARSRGSGRGYTVDVLVMDESQELTYEQLEALLPTISASPLRNPQVIIVGTPPKPDAGERGAAFRSIRDNAIKKTDARLAFTDFGVADGPMPDVTDRQLWAKCNPALGGRLLWETIEAEFQLMKGSPESFARERLGWWGDPDADTDADRAFPAGSWRACLVDTEADDFAIPVPRAVGIAVSMDRAWSSVGLASASAPTFLGATRRDRGTDWVVAEAADIALRHRIPVVIDGHGPAASLIPDLEALGVTVIVAQTSDYLSGCALLYDAVVNRGIVHGGFPELDEAVEAAKKRIVGDRWAWARKLGDISMLEAATLAFWAVMRTGDPNYDIADSFG